jgi:hypothetical protein
MPWRSGYLWGWTKEMLRKQKDGAYQEIGSQMKESPTLKVRKIRATK